MADTQNSRIRVRETSIDDVRRLAASGHLCAIVDACNVATAPKKALELGDQRAVSLYRGSPQQDFWDVAPYLFRADPLTLEWVLENASKEGWGLLVASKSDLQTLRYHFRHFLRVQEPAGEIWHFRFYDPRVLKPFLPACSAPELRTFFGPVLAYGLTGPDFKNIVFFQETTSQTAGVDQMYRPNYSFIFRLRSEHIEALRPQADAEFALRLVEHLRRTHVGGAENMDDDALVHRVNVGLLRARRYNFIRESTRAAFVALMFEFAPNFDEHPKMRSVLADDTIASDDRIDVLVERASDEDWEQVERQVDQSAWNLVAK